MIPVEIRLSSPPSHKKNFATFNHKHYHLTNSKIFVSGTVLDAMDSMDLIDSYLQQYEYDGNVKKESEIAFQIQNEGLESIIICRKFQISSCILFFRKPC